MGISGVNSGYHRYSWLLNAEGTQQKQSSQAGADVGGLLSTESSYGDLLDISAEAQAIADAEGPLRDRLTALLGDPNGDGRITLTELKVSREKAQASVQSGLQSLFEENGIDTSQEIQLQVASDGIIVVANNHPQKEEIEELIAGQPELRNDFVRMTAQSEIIGAAEDASEFQAAYAKNPYAAVAQFAYLFDLGNSGSVSMSILGDQYDLLYQARDGSITTVGGKEG